MNASYTTAALSLFVAMAVAVIALIGGDQWWFLSAMWFFVAGCWVYDGYREGRR